MIFKCIHQVTVYFMDNFSRNKNNKAKILLALTKVILFQLNAKKHILKSLKIFKNINNNSFLWKIVMPIKI